MGKKKAAKPAPVHLAPSPDESMAGGLSPLELHAVAIYGKQAGAKRSLLPVGKGQPVDFAVRLHGNVDVAGDSTANKTTPPKAEDLLTIVFAHLGKETRRSIFEAVRDVHPKLDKVELPVVARELAKLLIADLTTCEEQPKKGAVAGQIVAELVPLSRARKPGSRSKT